MSDRLSRLDGRFPGLHVPDAFRRASFLVVLFQILLGSSPALAQGISPLAGKTVHVLNPVPGSRLYLDIAGTGHPMTALADHWMVGTIPATISDHFDRFGVRNDYGQGNFWIARTGIAASGAETFTEADFAGKDTLWILIDPAGPSTAAPALLTVAPKAIKVYNPWPGSAPALRLSVGTRKAMVAVPGSCGWYMAYLIHPADLAFHLEDANGADTYGAGGLGTRTPYNLAPEFASKGATLWLDTDINAWLPSRPGKVGICQYMMAATVRDFSSAHPDFDFLGLSGEQLLPGMVQSALGPDRKPVRTAKTSPYFNLFESWWRTDTANADTAMRSYETCVDIPMSKTADGLWEYDSYLTPARGFWPIDDFANPNNEKTTPSCHVIPNSSTWVTGGPARNMNFCMESHATFVYQPGQTFVFRGDDDVWVYIDGRLVIDLGGVHTPKPDSVDLDKLGLTPGREYKWDFFSCDRQPCASSLRIKTSINFKQQRALMAEPVPGAPGAFEIRKFAGGNGSCLPPRDTMPTLPVTGLVYKLLDAFGAELETLPEGSSHGGGIVIATPKVAVDTAKLRDLPNGAYRIVAYEAISPGTRAEILLTVRSGSTSVRARPRKAPAPDLRRPGHDALGRPGHPRQRRVPIYR